MNNGKWTWAAIGWMCSFAYCTALIVNQFGKLFTGGGFGVGTVAALLVLAGMLYLLFRPAPEGARLNAGNARSVSAGA